MAKRKSKGLGDTVEKITKATGIKKAVHAIFGDDCGCDKRKEWLNKVFPYKMECLNEDEYLQLKEWFSKKRLQVKYDEQVKLLKIYNRVFNRNLKQTTCASCVRNMVRDLERVYYEYEKELTNKE